jgi:hypothetical protein
MDDGDVAKFTDAIKDFDGMTRLVCCLLSMSNVLSSLIFFYAPFLWQLHSVRFALHAHEINNHHSFNSHSKLCHGKVHGYKYI